MRGDVSYGSNPRRAQLRVADPGAQIVGGVEARVHIREMGVARVAHTGRAREPLGVVLARRPGVLEARPEAQLELQLRRVPAKQERFKELRRLRIRPRVLVT